MVGRMANPIPASPSAPSGTAPQGALPNDAVRTVVRLARMFEHACVDLTLPQYRVLAMVDRGDHRVSHLAGRLALSKPTVTAVVEGLVERGLLSRSEVAADRRVVKLSLTDAGRAALETTEAAMVDRLNDLLRRCDDPAVALAGLAQLTDAVERVLVERMAEGATRT
jgi:DNA-binding MarR family transcriptional regulator